MDISASSGLELLQMVSESNTRGMLAKTLMNCKISHGLDDEIKHSL